MIYHDDVRRCLACGDRLFGRKRRYCDGACRTAVQEHLDRRTGLLRALNTRYATYYFTPWVIVMDLLPYDAGQIFSFLMPRRNGEKPIAAFRKLSYILGGAWWDERRRTNKRYLAARHVLEKGKKTGACIDRVRPLERLIPATRKTVLLTLNLRQSDLINGGNVGELIKKAYRREAKKHHPDLGGDPVSFRRIQEAYECLAEWSRRPSFTRRRGFPDKWLYEGSVNRWKAPAPPG